MSKLADLIRGELRRRKTHRMPIIVWQGESVDEARERAIAEGRDVILWTACHDHNRLVEMGATMSKLLQLLRETGPPATTGHGVLFSMEAPRQSTRAGTRTETGRRRERRRFTRSAYRRGGADRQAVRLHQLFAW